MLNIQNLVHEKITLENYVKELKATQANPRVIERNEKVLRTLADLISAILD